MRKKVTLILLTILIALLPSLAFASSDYIKDGEFYTLEDGVIDDLFDFKLKDTDDPLGWFSNFQSYIVIQELEDGSFKGYFNTPNTQELAKNITTSEIDDGYPNSTFNSEYDLAKELMDKSPILRYGFNLPNYYYFGEYPKEIMSVNHIIPENHIQLLWRALKALIGLSFIDAPNQDNYRTLSYLNNTYSDSSEAIIQFIQDYYIRYFVNSVDSNIFSSPQDFLDSYVEETTKTGAEATINGLSLTIGDKTFTGTEAYNEAAKQRDHKDVISYTSYKEALGYGEKESNSAFVEAWSAWKNSLPREFSNRSDVFLISKLQEGKLTALTPPPNYRDYTFEKNLFTNEMSEVIKTYQKAQDDINRYEAFMNRFNSGPKGYESLQYRQCLISSDKEGTCTSSKHGEPTSLSLAHVYALSGLYKETEGKTFLRRDEAIKIIQKLQSYTGPYYKEVLTNLIICMQENAKTFDTELVMQKSVDKRVMPYDIDTLNKSDRESLNIRDPRVEVYKEHVIGKAIGDFELGGNLIPYFKLQPLLIDLAGKLTLVSVFLNTLINFEFLDQVGLSPATMWDNGLITLVIIILSIVFMVKTLKAALIFIRDKRAPHKIIISFLILFLEIGFLSALSINPEESWTKIKKPINQVMSLGEQLTIAERDDLDYLFEDGSPGITTYYLPYLDIWSQYNTGYSLFADEQYINQDEDLPELKDVKLPKIGSKEIKHYSIMLLDSFSYHGSSESVLSTTVTDSEGRSRQVNGSTINNNAYRVVDHFLAPRISIEKNQDDTLKLSVTQNENYNGNYQKGFLDIITKLVNVFLMLFISIIKLLTFIWFWFKLYIFLFQVILDKTVRRLDWKSILRDTFEPLIALILIGVYAGMTIQLSGMLTGLIGLLMQIGLFFLTNYIILLWSSSKSFPKVLQPIALIANFGIMKRRFKAFMSRAVAKQDMSKQDIIIEEEVLEDPEAYRRTLFDEEGQPIRFSNLGRQKVYDNWVKDLERRQTNGEQVSEKDLTALKNYQTIRGKFNNEDDKIKAPEDKKNTRKEE